MLALFPFLAIAQYSNVTNFTGQSFNNAIRLLLQKKMEKEQPQGL